VGDREIGGDSFAVINVENAGDIVLILSHLEILSKSGSWKNRVKWLKGWEKSKGLILAFNFGEIG
jgi:hypothetical protein